MTEIATRTAKDITNGSWIVRFTGKLRPTGVIAKRNWVETDMTIGSHKVYEAAISVSETNGTTLASAAKIIEVAGFRDVMPIVAWKIDENNGVEDTFRWFA